jgi:hypothetical protein
MPKYRPPADLDKLLFRERLSPHAGSLSTTKNYYWNLSHIDLAIIEGSGSRGEDRIIRGLASFDYRLFIHFLGRGKLLLGDVSNTEDR